jgi:queuosine precursor transporter
MNGLVTERERDMREIERSLHGRSIWHRPFSLVLVYLLAIVLANLMVSWFGAGITIINAFLFIGLDLTNRDKLHDAWNGRGLVWKMGLLIAMGSIISWGINRASGRIALASFIAFACASVVDTLVYQILYNRSKLIRVNGSNVISAGMDSILFPAIAFGFPLMFGIMAGQFLAKVSGGFIWFWILRVRK